MTTDTVQSQTHRVAGSTAVYSNCKRRGFTVRLAVLPATQLHATVAFVPEASTREERAAVMEVLHRRVRWTA